MGTLILDPNVVVTIDVSGDQRVHCSGSSAPVSGITPPVSGIIPIPPVMFVADVVNHSSKLTSTQLTTLTDAVKKQLDGEGAAFWGSTASFNFGAPISGHAKLGVFDTSDQPGALGWHDDQNDQVTIEIFYIGALSDVGVTISHEMMETIGDYNANTVVNGVDPSGKPCLFYRENCDPVESDTYKIDGVDVSNFVTPAWFKLPAVAGAPDGRFDFLKRTTTQFEIEAGGYMEVSYDNGQTWSQIQERTSRIGEFSGSRTRMRNDGRMRNLRS